MPEPWRYTVSQGKQRQFNLLRKLMCSEDVSEVINACDAGREGELIFRTVYALAGCTKPMKRLWISSMEDNAIREGFANLHSGQKYDALYEAAKCRARADWLVGINATRLFSVLYHRTLNVGRVVSPTLALIVQREAEINAFVPQPFYTVEVQSGELLASSERLKTEAEAKTVAAACQGQAATVTSVERKEKTEKPPTLFDLTALQRSANRLLGYTAQQTLDYLQALYEKKLVTYPRTDSRFLTDDMLDKVPKIAEIASKITNIPLGEINAGQVCNSKKVSDHYAIVPTMTAGNTDLSALPAGEREILKMVSQRVLCAVGAPHVYEETIVTLSCGGETFTVKGKTVISMGWKANLQQEQVDKALPQMLEGMTFPVENVSEGGQNNAAEAVHRGYAALCYGDCRCKGNAGRRREKGTWYTRHSCRYSGKTGVGGVRGAQKTEKSGQPCSLSKWHILDYRSAGAASIPAAHRRMGAEIKTS